MHRFFTPLVFPIAVLLIAPQLTSAGNITIDTVFVGNPGNAPDTLSTHNNPGNLLFGAVDYSYRIGAYEVTNAQYAVFLNAKATIAGSGPGTLDSLALYSTDMGSATRGGIARSGAGTLIDPYVYSVKPNMGNKPVNYVSWYDAVRFSNWLHNGQGPGDTETGAYTLLGGTPTPTNNLTITRNAGATWWLPSEDEWYKAAYYDPTLNGGAGDYWNYATQSNTAPTQATADGMGNISNPGGNVANYDLGADWNSVDGNVTTVGSAGPLSESYYGTSDQTGNVYELNEALLGSLFGSGIRGLRGGSWSSSFDFGASDRGSTIFSPIFVGFRVATVPEPSSFILGACGAATLIGAIARRRSQRGLFVCQAAVDDLSHVASQSRYLCLSVLPQHPQPAHLGLREVVAPQSAINSTQRSCADALMANESTAPIN